MPSIYWLAANSERCYIHILMVIPIGRFFQYRLNPARNHADSSDVSTSPRHSQKSECSGSNEIPAPDTLRLDTQASALAERGACAAMFAHEVNNVMTQIGGRAQLALMYPDRTELSTKALELTMQASTQLSLLAESMMTGDPSLTLSDRDLSAGVGLLAPIEHIHEQTVSFLDPEDVSLFGFEIQNPLRVQSPQLPVALLQQVLLNFYLNSIQAIRREVTPSELESHLITLHIGVQTNEGVEFDSVQECSTRNTLSSDSLSGPASGLVTETGSREELATPYYILMIEDSGPGFGDDQINGHGLGLQVCEYLLNQFGAHWEQMPHVEGGARVIIRVPYCMDVDSAQSRSIGAQQVQPQAQSEAA